MRRMILTLSLALSVLAAPAAALAAPTCQDKAGVTTRCGTPNAMPVGWTLPADQRPAKEGDLAPSELLSLICIIGGFFALIALMPDFDGWGGDSGGDEDEEEPG